MKLIDFMTLALTAAICVMCLLTQLLFIVVPTLPNLSGNILPNTWYFFPSNYMIPVQITIIHYANINLVLECMLIYGTVVLPFIVNELYLSSTKRYKSTPQLRKPSTLRVIYRTAQIVQWNINDLLGKFLIPLQTLCSILFIFGCFILIRHRETMHITMQVLLALWCVGGAMVWALFLIIGGYLHSKGIKLLNSWKHHSWTTKQERMEFHRFRLSCKSIRISFGSTYVIQRKSVMIFQRGLIRGIMRALLAIRK